MAAPQVAPLLFASSRASSGDTNQRFRIDGALMTVVDDANVIQADIDAMTAQANGVPPATTTSAADWQTINGSITTLNANAQFANSNDYAALVSAIHALGVKWDGMTGVLNAMPAHVAQLKTDAAALATTPPALPPAVSTTTPGVVVVPGANTTTTVAPLGFTGGQTATVGLVGAAVGLGVGWMMWKNPHRVSNPRRRRHRKVSEAAE